MAQMPIHCRWYNYMSHGLPNVTLQSTQHKVILHSLREVTSQHQVISNDPSVTSMFLMVQNARKCITYIYYIIKQLLTYVSIGRHGVLLNSNLNHIDLSSASVNMTLTLLFNNTPCPPQHKSIVYNSVWWLTQTSDPSIPSLTPNCS